jgi:hypothetical protein
MREKLIKKLWKQSKFKTSAILIQGIGILQFQSFWDKERPQRLKEIFKDYNLAGF